MAEAIEEGGEKAPPLRVLWITPMRALAGDTVQSLAKAVEGAGLAWTIGIRTGDTSAAERAKQASEDVVERVMEPESIRWPR